MRKFIIISIVISTINTFAQPYQQIQNIDGRSDREQGVYYKDINNVFDDFVGTYVYEGNGIYLKFVLQKKELSSSNGIYWQDMIIGGYQYKLNGNEVINCLNDVNVSLEDGRLYNLYSSSIRPIEHNAFCNDCLTAKWLWGGIFDPISGRGAELFMARKLHNGQPALYVWLYLNGATLPTNNPQPPINLPTGETFTLIKVN